MGRKFLTFTNKNDNLHETLGRIKVDNATLKKREDIFEKKSNKAEDSISINNTPGTAGGPGGSDRTFPG